MMSPQDAHDLFLLAVVVVVVLLIAYRVFRWLVRLGLVGGA